jgi:ankyrin repeat protein
MFLGCSENKSINLRSLVKGIKENEMLIKAVKDRNIPKIKEAIDLGAKLNAKDLYKQTPLMLASEKGFKEIVIELLQIDSSDKIINARTDTGRTALMYASEKGHIEIVNILLENGAKVNCTIKNGVSALMLAAENGNAEIVHKLINAGARFNLKAKENARHERDSKSALMLASKNGHIDVVKYLLEVNTISYNDIDQHGISSLMWASKNGHINIVEMLINKGADLNLRSNDKQYYGYGYDKTALGEARNDEIRKMLIDNGGIE